MNRSGTSATTLSPVFKCRPLSAQKLLQYAAFGSILSLGAMSGALANPCAVKRGCGACAPRQSMSQGCEPNAPPQRKRKAGCGPSGCGPSGCGPAGCGPNLSGKRFTRPDGYEPQDPARTPALVKRGKELWNDTSLSSNGMSCNSCHQGSASLNDSFAQPYPHEVGMPKQMAGVERVHADEMVQFCMVSPMQAEPLEWGSERLDALTAYTHELQQAFSGCGPSGDGNKCGPGACGPAQCGPAGCRPSGCNPCSARYDDDSSGEKRIVRRNPDPIRR